MQCQTCREKDAELLTPWERTRNWLFERMNHALFTVDFDDMKSGRYTQGYADGYVDGTEKQKKFHEEQLKKYGA